MMKIKILDKNIFPLLFVLGLFSTGLLYAQDIEKGRIEPVAYLTMENGRDTTATYAPEELIEGSAPMRIDFRAQVTAPDTVTWRSEWQMSRTNQFDDSPDRYYVDNLEYTFLETGRYYVRLLITFTENAGHSYEDGSDIFEVAIYESELEIPNAFSPNGDGINDIFKVYHKSIVKFNAYVFNRWGQQLYHWGINNIDDGWDGTYKGKPVRDGVYFIVVNAEGSDGQKFNIKGDINILRGYSGTGSSPTPEE